MFLSPRHSGVDQATACDRLRRVGEIARRHGVVVALETHPDLGTNGDVHLADDEANQPSQRPRELRHGEHHAITTGVPTSSPS